MGTPQQTTDHQAVVALSRALDQAGDVLAAVRPDHLDRPTPCEGWTVRQLVGHLAATPANFLAMNRGEDVDWSAEHEPSDTYVADYRASADDLIHHWHQRPDSDAPQADFQTAELALHTWDLARAIGWSRPLEPLVAERALAMLEGALTPDNRGDAFRPPVDVPADAPVYDRLAGFAGRDPSTL
ncbi:TIGR03086 family protein [Nocardioides gansuensis]|uniref:TIGR03086 family protein n=1 Tax=Nocardioides gansuensis TaxID=2138300 RepID=A0A2T8F9Q1_9ACTN|nr:TIGR03086 family metal-binding protein [Nocardioides gansuensis]PVG82397.1 TIGR03086 family protein [Nocardioides gansuensis]